MSNSRRRICQEEKRGILARLVINVRVGAKFQRATDVLIVDEFPRTVAGKTLKRVLQEQHKKA